jgi:hypothetical protein
LTAQPQVDTFCALLHVGRAKRQREGNRYPGKIEMLQPEDVAAHLRGQVPYALASVSGGLAAFGAIDVDRDFPRRLQLFARAALDVGGSALQDAAFATSGSDNGRGKVILTFAQPVAREVAVGIVAAVVECARNDPDFGPVRNDALTLFPKAGDGGFCRVLGANLSRGGPVERALSLHGEPRDLRHVVPLSVETAETLHGSLRSSPRLPNWVNACLTEPWVRAEIKGTKGAFARLLSLARSVVRVHGVDYAAQERFAKMVEQIRLNSPDFARPGRSGHRRNVLSWRRGGRRAWDIAYVRRVRFHPQSAHSLPPSDARLYESLAAYVNSDGLDPAMFAMDYAHMAKLANFSDKRNCCRSARRLIAAGLLDLVDPGAKHTVKRRGLPTLWGMVGQGDTLDLLRKRREGNAYSRARLEVRATEREDVLDTDDRRTGVELI